jgi:site-specific recombinase XerD
MSNHHLPTQTRSNQFAPKTTSNAAPNNPQTYGVEDIRYYIDGFILHHRSQQHSQATITSYKYRLRNFVWFQEQNGYPTELEAITPNHIRHFLSYLAETKSGRWDSSNPRANAPLTQASIHTYARDLKAFFRWAAKEADLPRNLFENIRMPALPNQWQVQVFSDQEIEALFAAVERMGEPFIVQRNRALLAILLDSGLRAAELLSLKVDDINPQEGVFSVTGKGGKRRTVVIGSFARKQLWAYLSRYRLRTNTPEVALFLTRYNKPFTYAGLRRMFERLRALSGIDRVSVRAHICRHTAATIMHRNGMRGSTLQEVLGHSTFEVTRKYYVNITPEDLRKEHELYGPLDILSKQLKLGHGSSPAEESSVYSGTGHSSHLPSAEVLAREVAKSSYCAVARRYGVSDTAIRKRIKKAGLL